MLIADTGYTKEALSGKTLEQLTDVVMACRLPRFAARQIAAWIYKRRVRDINSMTDISMKGREELSCRYSVGITPPVMRVESVDGTVKYLFDVGKGKKIEAVYIPDRERATLCVSSQIGCRMNCKFCMTGSGGFHGNLSAEQIVNQILAIPESHKLTNVVFMGMGEPLDNLEPVLRTIEIMTSEWGIEWSPRRITVSSIGKMDNLRVLLEQTDVHIAISVHSPFPEERGRLMPVEKAFPIKEVVNILSHYDFTRQRRCSMEYIMWNGVNDDMKHADSLARLLKPISGVRVNLIRFHAVPCCPGLSAASQEAMIAFRDRLNRHGITATIRASRGEDIMAACGMLAGTAYKDINPEICVK